MMHYDETALEFAEALKAAIGEASAKGVSTLTLATFLHAELQQLHFAHAVE